MAKVIYKFYTKANTICVIIKIISILGIKSMSDKNTKKIGLLPIHLAKLGLKM